VARWLAALGDSEDPELSTRWALLEVGLAVGYPGREGVGGGGSAVLPRCTCSSVVFLMSAPTFTTPPRSRPAPLGSSCSRVERVESCSGVS